MSDTVTYELDGEVAVVRLDDGKANVLGHEVLQDLHRALDRAEQEARAVALVGRPGYLSGGFDLAEFARGPEATRDLVIAGARLHLRLFTFPRPVVVAATGHAVAAGAIVLLAADWTVGAAGTFRIGLPEVAIKMPLPAFAVELARYRLRTRAFDEATLFARMYDPDSAREAGYLDVVTPPEATEATAITRAAELASTLSPGAFALTRPRVRGPVAAHIETGLVADVTALTTGLGA
ncbi:MAG: crotonase/enoyl-CoA hydratase family protein [Acidimicrobiales bacterium]|jgi:enoyl-CoA hydratase|nr:crotonase/enoyl-CoA hydratase family protein [Acidimicrobiales bacterium]